jgi:hypothetical protein
MSIAIQEDILQPYRQLFELNNRGELWPGFLFHILSVIPFLCQVEVGGNIVKVE